MTKMLPNRVYWYTRSVDVDPPCGRGRFLPLAYCSRLEPTLSRIREARDEGEREDEGQKSRTRQRIVNRVTDRNI